MSAFDGRRAVGARGEACRRRVEVVAGRARADRGVGGGRKDRRGKDQNPGEKEALHPVQANALLSNGPPPQPELSRSAGQMRP